MVLEIHRSIYEDGTSLSEINEIDPFLLKPHPENNSIFNQESEEDFERLKQDIKQYGIHDPLIITPEMTIITGHRRCQAALELKLETVPIRYLQGNLDEEQVLRLMKKDNLLRRQI
ncbi:MAG: ParB N-terminal domain-containing protein [Spirochaetes bacterium]|nr:ParB N-terminal domain-containing protein [Spirochaetota bacterium]MCK5267437.1 ParB N-terminal domain-containing protein [Spirochaetota bacterium]